MIWTAVFPLGLAAHEHGHEHDFPAHEFIQNKGQWHPNIQYKVNLPEGYLYLEKNQLKFHLVDLSFITAIHTGTFEGNPENIPIQHHVYTTTFLNANPNPIMVQEDVLEKYHNYYLGNDQKKWASRTPVSHAVRYKSLYPGVDLLVYNQEGNLKYDFVCKNARAAQQIRIRYDGQDEVKIKDKQLLVKTQLGDVFEAEPYVYQNINEKKIPVKSRYRLNSQVLSFDLEVEDPYQNEPIVIDPVLIFSTYSGSTTTNFGFTATYDSEGFLYSGSIAFGSGYPTTTGAFKTVFQGGSGLVSTIPTGCDVAITKYDTSGTKTIYSTYLGGSGDEMPHSMVVNSRDELYVYGTTGSQNFPVSNNAYQKALKNPTTTNRMILPLAVGFNDGSDLFVCAFTPDGTNLSASTYIGGGNNDGINNPGNYGAGNPQTLKYNYADEARGEIDIDNDDNVYVASCTRSNDFPIHGTPFFPNYRGGLQDGIIIKLSPTLNRVIWSSYLGGIFTDAIYSLAIDKKNDITVVGGTNSSAGFPSGALPGYTTFQGGRCDGFVTHIKGDGSSILNSTYFGSNEYDQVYFVERDKQQNVYLFGQTEDTSRKLIHNALYNTPTAGQFVSKLTPSLDSIIWSTKFGTASAAARATPNISPSAFLVDLCNSVYLSGWGGNTNRASGGNNVTTVTGMDTTAGAFQTNTDGSDFYLMVLADDASRITYGSFFGGPSADEHVDGGTSRFDRKGKIYQSVCAGCPRSTAGTSDFPTHPNPGAVSNLNGARNWGTRGGCNNAVFKIDFLLPSVVADFQIPRQYCINDSIEIKNTSLEQGASTYRWYFGNGDSSNLESPKPVFVSTGTFEVMLVIEDSNSCNLSDTISKKINLLSPSSLVLPNDSICLGDTVQLGIPNDPSYGYTWLPGGDIVDDSTAMRPKASPKQPTRYTALIETGLCVDTHYQFIQVDSFILARFQLPDSICQPDTLELINTSTILAHTQIQWNLGVFGTSTQRQPQLVIQQSGVYPFTLSLTDTTACLENSSINGTITAVNDTSYALLPVLSCNGSPVQIGILPHPAHTYTWTNASGLSDSTRSNPNATVSQDVTYQLLIEKSYCTDTLTQTVQADSIRVQTSSDTVICSNVTLLNLAAQHFGTGIRYHWSSNPQFSDQINATLNDSIAPVSPTDYRTVYYFQSESQRGCNAVDSSVVLLNDFGIEISDSSRICFGDTLVLSVRSLTQNDTLSVVWTPFEDVIGPNDSTQLVVTPKTSRTYLVDIGTSFKCKSEAGVFVWVSQLDTQAITLSGTKDTIIQIENSELTVQPTGFAYQWSPSTGLSSPFGHQVTAQPDTSTLYTVDVFDPEMPECRISRNYRVEVIELNCGDPAVFLPNTFTPNGDGINDELKLHGNYIDAMDLKIYDRWGELIFESQDQSKGWDGVVKNNEVWSDVFVYQLYVKCADGQEYRTKGDITLIK